MKNFLYIIFLFVAVSSLVACDKLDNTQTAPNIANNNSTEIDNNEKALIGNTKEEIIAISLDQYYKSIYGYIVEEVVPINIKIYANDELSNNEIFKYYDINEDDIVFEANYKLKIVDGFNNMEMFTAETGNIDGQWIINKHNVGIVRKNNESGYFVDVLGISF